jgi:hypothetical protein
MWCRKATGVLLLLLLLLVVLTTLAAAQSPRRDNSRTALNNLDRGRDGDSESLDNVSETTRREVERQKMQREARKKRQMENREKRKKRLEEMNSRIRRKEMRSMVSNKLWIFVLLIVMGAGCYFAATDLSILLVTTFGRHFGMDVDAFVKRQRRAAAGSRSFWTSLISSAVTLRASSSSGGIRPSSSSGGISTVGERLSAGNISISSNTTSAGSTQAAEGAGRGGSLGSWFGGGNNKSRFKNSEDVGDEESGGGRRVVFAARTP